MMNFCDISIYDIDLDAKDELKWSIIKYRTENKMYEMFHDIDLYWNHFLGNKN